MLKTLVAFALAASFGAGASAATLKSSAAEREAGKERLATTAALARIAKGAKVRPAAVIGLKANKTMRRIASAVRLAPPRPSFGRAYGLHEEADSLELSSGVALVLDQDTNEVLFSKNPQAVLPIASLTKLMTALVVIESGLPLDEPITIADGDVDTEKGSRSRLRVGTTLRRSEMLHLALMSSENRAANALGRSYPGGLAAFVAGMNQKARQLGMRDTWYVEPTGLSSRNQSSARDLATLVRAADEHQIIRELSTSADYEIEVDNRPIQFRNTNGLLKSPQWEIGLQKTGYISEAGRCLVMQASLAGRKLIMVFLDSAGKYSRMGDAERVRRWLVEAAPAALVGVAVKPAL